MSSKRQRKSDKPAADEATSVEEHPHVYVSPIWRVVVHIWVAVHLVALIAPPLAFATMGAAVPQAMYDATRPYIDLLFLDHGYAFFAPEVGANHLVEYRAEFANDRDPVVDRFPDLDKQWPRLLYHRHFMLSETLHNMHPPPDLPPEAYDASRERFEKLRDSFAEHIRHKLDAESVTLTRIEHRQPFAGDFERGMRLDDEQLYRELPDTLEPQPGMGLPGDPPYQGPPYQGPLYPFAPGETP